MAVAGLKEKSIGRQDKGPTRPRPPTRGRRNSPKESLLEPVEHLGGVNLHRGHGKRRRVRVRSRDWNSSWRWVNPVTMGRAPTTTMRLRKRAVSKFRPIAGRHRS